MSKHALVTGIAGQDGSYLAELLLEKGYEVYGLLRRSSAPNFERIERIKDRLHLISGDLLDETSLIGALETSQATEVYNLGAQSFVPASWAQPVLTAEITGVGVTRLLDAIRKVNPQARFYQASTSEMFGKPKESPQNEDTPFRPKSPYGAAKAYAHHITVNYRESYNLHATCGILFNHESPRRSLEFVTRKVTHTAARISLGMAMELRLGNLETQRDWGFAGDYVKAMWLMLQQEQADDYVVATGVMHTIEDLLNVAFGVLNLDWRTFVVQDPQFMRPVESDLLKGDASKAERVLGWKPETTFEDMIEQMVYADLVRLREGVNP